MCSIGTNSPNNQNNPANSNNLNIKSLNIKSSENISIAQGEQYTLEVYDNEDKNVNNYVTWVSLNPKIASVNSNGVVKIESDQGTTSIYAKYNTAISNKINFTSGRVIFATKNLYNGNLVKAAQDKQGNPSNGSDAANYLCNIDSNKPEFGNFKALIASSSEPNNLVNVLDTNKIINYINKDGSLIGYSQLGVPNILFNGRFVDNNLDEKDITFNWSGWSLYACNDWSNSNSDSTGGFGYGNNSNNWFSNDTPNLKGIWAHNNQISCNNYLILICVQQ
jgi:hypothetical protein